MATGVWNVLAVHPSTRSGPWSVVLSMKVGVAALAGLAAYLPARSATRRGLAVWGSMAGLSALGALVRGVSLVG